MMRAHRFPPLAQVRLASDGNAAADVQAAVAAGFQQGLDKGYAEGHAEGVAAGSEAARITGHADGMAAGRREVQQRFEHIGRPIDALFAELQQLKADYQAAQRREVVDLVARVARQVIRCELTLQPTQLLALVDETLAAMPPARDGQVEVHLNPEDLQRIQELAPERAAQWTLLADARLDSGECRVKAGEREADAGCRQRLAACMEQVAEQLNATPAEIAP
ncbi:flagellar assembly protein FliH [Pelomonas sp. KK5]|uniref:flagellar assembly protein FliH n=1 Tax=Pelomonas sp. KK5 TaxID=1855730 RepID=UPI00097C6EAC|nr:flagellar assembly protein FliH [Pelomonas sp. KK5]